jgi:uncharacterized protein (TIGR00255 family)
MLKSMTGYGQAKGQHEGLNITVEVRTLNSKFLDAQVRLPKNFQDKELDVRNKLNKELVRGKVSINVEVVNESAGLNGSVINQDLFKAYYGEFEVLAEQLGAEKSDLFRLALHSPDVLNGGAIADEELKKQWKLIDAFIDQALVKCNEFRLQEGKKLEEELGTYIKNIARHLEEVKQLDPERTQVIRERIEGHQQEISNSDEFDQNRFEQEMIYYIEKLDISEELVRLKAHLDYFLDVMSLPTSQGKKLGFVSQEIGREINTIGSKANFAPVQRLVVDMKDDLEKIKEQLLNII